MKFNRELEYSGVSNKREGHNYRGGGDSLLAQYNLRQKLVFSDLISTCTGENFDHFLEISTFRIVIGFWAKNFGSLANVPKNKFYVSKGTFSSKKLFLKTFRNFHFFSKKFSTGVLKTVFYASRGIFWGKFSGKKIQFYILFSDFETNFLVGVMGTAFNVFRGTFWANKISQLRQSELANKQRKKCMYWGNDFLSQYITPQNTDNLSTITRTVE